jgi:hypothetical protein
MARQFSFANNFKIVEGFFPQATNAALTSRVVTTKNCHKVWAVFQFNQAVGHATTPTLMQATNIAAATNKAGPAVRIWSNEDCAASDTLVARTAASSFALTNDVKHKMVLFEIDTSLLDVNGGYDCIYFTEASSAQATNIVSMTWYLQTSYQQATPPTQIVD